MPELFAHQTNCNRKMRKLRVVASYTRSIFHPTAKQMLLLWHGVRMKALNVFGSSRHKLVYGTDQELYMLLLFVE